MLVQVQLDGAVVSMHRRIAPTALRAWPVPATRILALTFLATMTISPVRAQDGDDLSAWRVFVTNDNCPDYTWGLTEEDTRKAFAEIVRAHLDEMVRTDAEAPESRDRYNMAVTQEALCFIERYPERKEELYRRIREGRVFVSPFLCNSLWGFQSIEGAIRTLYPARRLEKEVGVRFDVAEHIEEPSLPWGMATILAGCGVRWVSVPFLAYDTTFGGLRNPPLFVYEGPDGSELRVILDAWASGKSNYTQGAQVLREPRRIAEEWIPHYRSLGSAWGLKAFLASGTHGDISLGSGGQARGFAEAIIRHNSGPGPRPTIINATLDQFTRAVDEAHAERPFLPRVPAGCFGHSWDLWPLCTAKYVAVLREGERRLLAAESLIATATAVRPEIAAATRSARERAEWCLAMLSDHAWNGTDEKNRRHNAGLRRSWGEELNRVAGDLIAQGEKALGLEASPGRIVLYNPLSFRRPDVVEMALPEGSPPLVPWVPAGDGTEAYPLRWRIHEQDGIRSLAFLSPDVPGFGLLELELRPTPDAAPPAPHVDLDRLRLRPGDDGPSGCFSRIQRRQIMSGGRDTLCRTVLLDGAEHVLAVEEVASETPQAVLRRHRIRGTVSGMSVETRITQYEEMERIDFDVRIRGNPGTREHRLIHVFPVLRPGAVLRVETPAAVIRPYPQPEGDLLPGADDRRMAVQGFVDASLPGGPGVTLVSLDAFALRLDIGRERGAIAFAALGNDQNHKEVLHDQNGETEFRFRYSLYPHEGPYDEAAAFAGSRAVSTPLMVLRGALPSAWKGLPAPELDPRRAIATCLKPADGDPSEGIILRFLETGGKAGPCTIGVRGYSKVVQTDLLERDIAEVPVNDGQVIVDLRAHGLAALRLIR